MNQLLAWLAEFNGVDIIAVAIVAASVLVGVFRGATGEAARLCGFGAGVFAGYYTVGIWQNLAAGWIVEDTAKLSRGIAVVVAVVLTAMVVWIIVSRIVKRFLKLLLEQPTDGILGFLFGGLRGVTIVLILFCLSSFILQGETADYVFWESRIGKASYPVVRVVRNHIGTAQRPFLGEGERWSWMDEDTKDTEEEEVSSVDTEDTE